MPDADSPTMPIRADDPVPDGSHAIEQSAALEQMRVTSDTFLSRLDRLRALEELKREVPADETAELARQVEDLTLEVLEWARRQTRLAEQLDAEDDALPPDPTPIATVPPRPLAVVLDEWRAAQRILDSEEPGTAPRMSAEADVARLRDEYARAYLAQARTTEQG